ncbi:inner membrane-spanning protein YciB [Aquibaculum sediminis]|uniref:inner membrane-spanning protein YciB n=1 Tax=Aquibaculum sediminis TaxID=3231907 RepID=UPI003453C0E7
MSGEDVRRAPPWLQPVCDYVPLGLFLAAYLLSDILTATAVLVVATLAATALSLAVARKLPVLALIAAAVVSVFGVLTLVFQDDLFIKIKPTVMQVLFAAALWISLWMQRPVLRLILGKAFPLRHSAWAGLTHRFAIFFLVMAAANEVVWRTQSTDFWVAFDTIGQMVITFAFVLSQVPFLMRHRLEQPEE